MQNRIYSLDNAKASKSVALGYLNAIHYMAPSDFAGVGNLCPDASPGCRDACLGLYSGHAGMVKHDTDINAVRASRIAKAQRFMFERDAYMIDVVVATSRVVAKAQRENLIPVLRFNGSTDIPVERIKVLGNPSIIEMYSHVQWVDYTKNWRRFQRPLPSNYHLTFSLSENNHHHALRLLSQGHNVAAVFRSLPTSWHGYPVINGDLHDLRHLDPKGVVVGLTPKGRKAKADTSGFVL